MTEIGKLKKCFTCVIRKFSLLFDHDLYVFQNTSTEQPQDEEKNIADKRSGIVFQGNNGRERMDARTTISGFTVMTTRR